MYHGFLTWLKFIIRRLELNFTTAPAASKMRLALNVVKMDLNIKNLALLILIRDTLCTFDYFFSRHDDDFSINHHSIVDHEHRKRHDEEDVCPDEIKLM